MQVFASKQGTQGIIITGEFVRSIHDILHQIIVRYPEGPHPRPSGWVVNTLEDCHGSHFAFSFAHFFRSCTRFHSYSSFRTASFGTLNILWTAQYAATSVSPGKFGAGNGFICSHHNAYS